MTYTFPLLLSFPNATADFTILRFSNVVARTPSFTTHNSGAPHKKCVSWVHVLWMVILYQLAWLTNAACRTTESCFTFACVRCYAGSMQAIFWTHRDAAISCIALGVAFAAVFYGPCLCQGLTTQTALLLNGSTNNCYILIMKVNEMHCSSDLFDKVLYMFRTCPLSIVRSIATPYTCNRYLSC